MALIDNLVSYWKCDEAAGNMLDAHDAHNGSPVGVTYEAAGIINTSYEYDGTNDYVELAHHADFEAANFSVMMWVYPYGVVGWRGLLVKQPNLPGQYRLNVNNNETIQFLMRDAGGNEFHVDSAVTLVANNWNLIIGTYDGTTGKLYINDAAPVSCTGTRGTGTTVIEIGWDPTWGAKFYGRIDEMGYWSKCLTADEVAALYNGGAGLAYPFAPVGTNIKVNIGDVFKDVSEIKVNIGDAWKAVNKIQINIGDSWKNVFG